MTVLGIDVREEGDVARLELTGEFDLAGIQPFEDAIRALEQREPRAIVVDLSQVQFMDSSGLRALVNANDRAERAERRFAVVPGPEHVRRVFEITQLDRRLTLVDDASAVQGD